MSADMGTVLEHLHDALQDHLWVFVAKELAGKALDICDGED